ncbi:hypothetical protein EV426DRAFT_679769 [Tirmania nivea]|nr:hypothetical protein EV426DRAFT_679769 [Tirmania nivea]
MGRRKAADSQSQSETQQQTPSQSQAPSRLSQSARGQASQKNVTQQQMQTQTQTQTQTQVSAVEEEKEKGNGSIKWDGNRGMLLAYKLRDEYRTKWLCGTRINVAKQWAIDLGISHLDPRGLKTKAAVAVMLKKYTQAKEVFLKTGSGDIMESGIVDGKPTEVPVSLTTQCKRICKHWDILWGALGNVKDDIAASGVGLNEAEMKRRLVIGGKLGEGGVTHADDDIIEDEDPPEVDSTTTTRASSGSDTPSLMASQGGTTDSSTNEEDFESGGDSAYDDLEPLVVKPTSAKRAAKSKRGDIAEVLFKDRSMGGVKKKKLSKMDEEMDLAMSIIKARQKRLEIEELKYRSRTGEKSSEQRAHEIRMAELELKKERAKVELEANRVKQLEFQWKLKQMGASVMDNIIDDAC